MKFYRSVLVIVLVVAIWFVSSLGLSEISALESNSLAQNVSPAQQYAIRLTPLQSQLLELESLISDENWGEVQSFLRGPLGDIEVRLRFLKNSFSPSQQIEASKKIENIPKYLTQLDTFAAAGNQARSLEVADALTHTFNEILSLAGVSNQDSSPRSPLKRSLKADPVKEQAQQPKRLLTETFSEPSTKKNSPSPEVRKTVQTRPPRKDLDAGSSSSQRSNNATENTLSTNRKTMDTNLSPDLTYIALILLVPLMIYLQIRYQHKYQEAQDRATELEGEIESLGGKIEALNQDKEKLGNALAQTQGRLVTMFMDLEETKPLAKLLQKRAVSVEEQEELIQENDSFVQALLQQVQETVSPEEKHVEG